MSHFEFYNTWSNGARTLRSYSRPITLERFENRPGGRWEIADNGNINGMPFAVQIVVQSCFRNKTMSPLFGLYEWIMLEKG